MHRYYCSYFDRNYLVKALSLIGSLNLHSTAPFTLYAVCLDEITRLILERLALPNVVTVPLHLVEEQDAELAAARRNRSTVEYYWTLTPTVLLWVLDRYPQIALITYLDADLHFFGDSEPIFRELGEGSVLIHAHRFPEELKHLEMYGKYNVGLLSFRRDERGMAALKWWRERCNEWCYKTIDKGRYADQGYLDDWPERFDKVHVLEHVGAGVAPWNHGQYRFGKGAAGEVQVEGRELIFYHFHAFHFASEGVVVPASVSLYPVVEEVMRLCVAPYLDALSCALAAVRTILPRFGFGLSNREAFRPEVAFVARKEFGATIRSSGIERHPFDLGNGWECYPAGEMACAAPRAAPPKGASAAQELRPPAEAGSGGVGSAAARGGAPPEPPLAAVSAADGVWRALTAAHHRPQIG